MQIGLGKTITGGLLLAGLLFASSAQAFPLVHWAYIEQRGYLYQEMSQENPFLQVGDELALSH